MNSSVLSLNRIEICPLQSNPTFTNSGAYTDYKRKRGMLEVANLDILCTNATHAQTLVQLTNIQIYYS